MEAATGERDGAAVLIGIGEYLHAEQVWPLRYAVRDAEAMAGVLSDPEVCVFLPTRSSSSPISRPPATRSPTTSPNGYPSRLEEPRSRSSTLPATG